ncbi:glutamate [NMDA] receptor subunit 1 [Ischnura elegans]|uniref:glutamate [NMDA] receptor subunit 1 n=1 Tax=Ischnura elegans TaxID=197161 RepID=UPI001ED88E2F|nr:glutamate [NMDA] receptor subunit 1 [Ischnura elegans]
MGGQGGRLYLLLALAAASGLYSSRMGAESRNPTYYNIGGVLSNNDSEFHFQEIIAHLNFESQYVPRGVTYYARAIRMDQNPIRTALNVCKYLIAQRVYAVVVSHPQTGDLSPAAVSYTSGFYHIPVIGISSRDSAFSDKNIHVSFLRTVPPYSHQADVWVQLLRHVGYTRVLFVHGSDTDGRALLGRFQTASSQLPPGVTLPGHLGPAGITIIGGAAKASGGGGGAAPEASSSVDDLDVKVQVEAVIEFEPGLESFTEQLTEMKTAQARVYLLYASRTDAEVIFRDAALLNMTEAGYVWLVTEQALDAENVPVGTLGLRLVNATKERAHVQDSIYILASALRDMNAKENITEAPNDCDNSGSIWETGKMLFEYIRRQVLLNGKTGKVAFDDNGDRINAEYDVVNVQDRGEQISVGQHYYCAETDKMALKLDEGAILWPGRLRNKPEGFMIPTHLKVLTIEEKPFVYVREVKWGTRAQGGGLHSTRNPEEAAFGSSLGASMSPSGLEDGADGPPPQIEGCNVDEVPCPHFNASDDGDEGGTMYCCKGFCVDLLKELAKTINFTYSMALSPDGQFGSYVAKNTTVGGKKEWTGLIGELVAERADMIVAPLTINPERAEFIEFSKPFKYQGITILEKKPSRSSTLVSFLQPFSNTLWILVMVSVHVVALVLYLLDRFSPFGRFRLVAPPGPPGATPSDARGPPGMVGSYCPSTASSAAATTEEDALNLSSAIWFAWGVLLNSGIGEGTPRSFSARVLGMVWAGFAMIIVASYTANLAAFLVLERPKTKLTGINDARLRNTMENLTCATVKGSAVDMYFRRQVELSNMYRTMEGNNYDTAEDAIRDVKAGKLMAFIWDSSRLEFEAAMDCELVTAGELFGRSGYGVGLQKGSPWADAVTLAILDFHESGFMERLDNKWVLQQGDGLGPMGSHCDGANTSEKTPNTLGLKNMAGVFILVAAGIVGGVALIVIEVAYKKHHARRQKRLELARHAADKWRGAVEKRRNLRATIAAQQQQMQQRRIKSNGINENMAGCASRSPIGNPLGLAPTSVGGVGSAAAAAAAAADLLRQRSPRAAGGMRVSAITGSDDGSPLFSNPSPRRLPSPTDLIV